MGMLKKTMRLAANIAFYMVAGFIVFWTMRVGVWALEVVGF